MSARQPLAVGAVIGGEYKILKAFEEGGFGLTYAAEKISSGQPVAIKEYFPHNHAVRDQYGNVTPLGQSHEIFDKYREAFRSEAQALSGFDHPNIVHVLNRFEANATSYFVMEFIEGGTLTAAVTRPLPTEAVMLLAEGLINGVKAVHDHGMLHRDIKPSNILLYPLREPRPTRLPSISRDVMLKFGRPVLLDFGAARIYEGPVKTMTGIVTPGFGAPEQSVERGRQDVRTDLYGLGATLYFCLADEMPPPSLERQQQDLLVPAQQRFRGVAPASFLRAIDRAMQLRPEHRPENIREFRAELFADLQVDDWSRPGKVYSAPGEGPYSGSRSETPASSVSSGVPAKRSGVGAMVASIFVIVAAAMGGGYWWVNHNSASASVRVDPTVTLMMRRMTASALAYDDISHLSIERSEMASMPDLVAGIDQRLSVLRNQTAEDKNDSFQMFQDLVQLARDNPGGVDAAFANLAAQAQRDSKPITVRRLGALKTLVQNAQHGGPADADAFSRFWTEQVGQTQ